MDINELEALVAQQKATITSMTSDAASATDELERMRGHQQTLLEETRTAKADQKTTTDALAALQVKIEEFENKGLVNENNYEELLLRQTEKMKLDFDSKLGDSVTALQEMTESRDKVSLKYSTEKVNLALRKAAEESKVIPSAIDDVVTRGSNIFSIGDDGSVEARDSEGNLRKIGKSQMTPKNFIESLKETAAHFWPASESADANGKGGSKNSGKNPWMKDSFNRTEQTRIANESQDTAKKMMDEAKAASS